MKTSIIKSNAAFYAGLLIIFPAFFIVVICIQKYTLGLEYFYDVIIPVFKSLSSKESLGFNINALIVIGPLLALILNLTVVLRLQTISTEEHIEFQITALKNRQNWAMVILNGLLLCMLLIYMLGEKCNC
jgi:hypothetical protein